MPIQFACSCGRKLQADEEHVGRRVRCPACGAETTVPGPEDAVQTTEPAQPKSSSVTPAESRRRDEDEDRDDRPRRRSRREDEDEDEDDRPRPRRRSRYDDEDEDDDRPRRGEPERTSGKAVAALVLGLLAPCLLFALAGIPAIILGATSLGEIKRSRGRVGGKGMATAGLVLGCLGCFTTLFLLVFPAVWKVRDAAARVQSNNNLHQMNLAMINDADVNGGRMLAPAICDKNGKPLLSWRVALLPYLEHNNLYAQFKLDEPWDGPNNSRLLAQMPKVYAHPGDSEANGRGYTHYRVFTGPQTAFPAAIPPFEAHRSSCVYPMSFADGTSNTILIVEATDAVPWTKPDELPYNPNGPLPKLGLKPGDPFSVALADGSTRVVQGKISDATLRAAITPNGNELLGPDW